MVPTRATIGLDKECVMAKRENFTSDRIAGFKCPKEKQQAIYWDAKAPGLGVRVTSAGAKSYIFETRLHGKTLRVTIGDQRTWTIGKAQAEARRLKTLTDQGIDPRQFAAEKAAKAREEDAEAGRQSVTLATAWAAYIEDRRHKWSERHLADHQETADPGGRKVKRGEGLTTPGALAALMPLKMAQIDARRVKAWLSKEAARRPTRARLAFNLFRIFLNWCESVPEYRRIVPPAAADNRIAKDLLPKKAAKTDCLQREQLPAWFDAVRAIGNPVISTYLQALLLTGARRESLAALKWEDVDFRWNSLTIRDKEESKGGADGTRTIPLTPYVAALFSDLKSRNDTPPPKHRILHGKRIENDLDNWQPSPWVFSSKTAASGRLADPTQAHYKACATAAIEGLTLHGLRRSFASLAEWVEMPTGVVAQIMGHKPSATAEKHYKRRPLDLLRLWHGRYEAWLLEQARIEFKAEQPRLRTVRGRILNQRRSMCIIHT
jgi:integrase